MGNIDFDKKILFSIYIGAVVLDATFKSSATNLINTDGGEI